MIFSAATCLSLLTCMFTCCASLHVPKHTDCYNKTDLGVESYRGTKSETKSGRSCQQWKAQDPHRIPAELSVFDDNYCRNPDANPEGPYCFTSDYKVRTESCGVPTCEELNIAKHSDCYDTADMGKFSYVGRKSETKFGRSCQQWSSQNPHKKSAELSRFHDNLCRNPTGEPGGPWCFTSDWRKRTESCGIPSCAQLNIEKHSDCFEDEDFGQFSYAGTQTVTKTGTPCQKWSEQSPHRKAADLSLHEDALCRNPTGDPSGPWCFTTDWKKRTETCGIPSCSVKNLTLHNDCYEEKDLGEFSYAGSASVTVSGRTCQAWNVQNPHKKSAELSIFQDNKCRNPSRDPKGPYCFTTDWKMRTESCGIPLCSSISTTTTTVAPTTTTTTTTTLPPTTTTTTEKPLIKLPSKVRFIGCYKWTQSESKRLQTAKKPQDIKDCKLECSKDKFLYMSVNSKGLCSCSNFLPSSEATECSEEACDSEHEHTCALKSLESVYTTGVRKKQLPAYAIFVGCFKEKESNQFKNFKVSKKLTPHSCLSECKKKKFLFFGLQNGKDCLCGNSHGSATKESSCGIVCEGDKHFMCGDSKEKSVYKTGVATKKRPLPSYASYLGCFKFKDSKDFEAVELPEASPHTCLAACRKGNFFFFAMQDGDLCLCGNSVGQPSSDGTECSSVCVWDYHFDCGSSTRRSVYNTGITKKELPKSATYVGCFKAKDTADFKVFGVKQKLTPHNCLSVCKKKRYLFFGLENGRECLCGSSHGRETKEDKCGILCEGDHHYKCGGDAMRNVYGTGVPEKKARKP